MVSKRFPYFFLAIAGLLLIAGAVHAAPSTADVYPLFPGESATADFREYIKAFYQFSIAAGTIMATVLIMIGGMIWVTSAGNPVRIDKAKSYIIDSIIGVVLLISAYTILQAINPNFVELPSLQADFKSLGVNIGACIYKDETNTKYYCRVSPSPDDCAEPGSVQSGVSGQAGAGQFFSGKDCASVCTSQADGSCELKGDAKQVSSSAIRGGALPTAPLSQRSLQTGIADVSLTGPTAPATTGSSSTPLPADIFQCPSLIQVQTNDDTGKQICATHCHSKPNCDWSLMGVTPPFACFCNKTG